MPLQRASDVISKMKAAKSRGGEYVKDWRSMIPPGSRWCPGMPGRPDCPTCDGTGYVRFDVPVDHPSFGKIFLCDCVPQTVTVKLNG